MGHLFLYERERGRVEFIRIMRRHRGKITDVARELGFDRRYIFRILWRESLWHELDMIRAEFATAGSEPAWLRATKQALGR